MRVEADVFPTLQGTKYAREILKYIVIGGIDVARVPDYRGAFFSVKRSASKPQIMKTKQFSNHKVERGD